MVDEKEALRMNNERTAIIVIILAIVLAVELAVSFYTYGNIWHLSDPASSYMANWVWYVSLVVFGTALAAILLWEAIGLLRISTNFSEVSLLFGGAGFLSLYFTVWPGLVWAESQAMNFVANDRIAWTVVAGMYVIGVALCAYWISDDGKKEGQKWN